MVLVWTGQNAFRARKQPQSPFNAQETPKQVTTPWLVTVFNIVRFEALILRSSTRVEGVQKCLSNKKPNCTNPTEINLIT